MVVARGDYAAWASWLEAFGRGEDLPDHHLVPIDDGSLGPHMQERLLRRVSEAFMARGELWGEVWRRHLDAATPAMREPSELGALLVDARRRLRPLRALTENPLLPATLRDPLRDALREMLTSAQDSLERSVRRQPQNAERLLAVVRENGLLAALSTPRLPPAPGPAQPPGSAPNSPPVGRRVIL